MTAVVPGPRDACADCVRINGGVCCVPENCAAVPGPRFRDQLAEDFRDLLVNAPAGVALWMGLHFDEVAARMEARVQAATKQRAAEVRCTRGYLESEHWQDGRYSCPTPPTSPAPAPRAEEDQHSCPRWCAQHTAMGGPLDAAEPTGGQES